MKKVTKKGEEDPSVIPLTPKKPACSSKVKLKAQGMKSSTQVPKQHQPTHTITLRMMGVEGTEGPSSSLTESGSSEKKCASWVHTSVSEGKKG